MSLFHVHQTPPQKQKYIGAPVDCHCYVQLLMKSLTQARQILHSLSARHLWRSSWAFFVHAAGRRAMSQCNAAGRACLQQRLEYFLPEQIVSLASQLRTGINWNEGPAPLRRTSLAQRCSKPLHRSRKKPLSGSCRTAGPSLAALPIV